MVMSGSSTTLKAFKETDMMATARSLVSLLSAFVKKLEPSLECQLLPLIR
jgi:hypothetical protein